MREPARAVAWLAALGAGAALGACGGGGGASTDTRTAAIIGGAIDPGDAAAAYVVIDGGACSGVLVAPTVVLTAAHCAAPGVGMASPGTVSFGAGVGNFDETIAIRQLWVARGWPADATADVALVRLAHAAAAAPATWDLAATAAIGQDVRVVGFGKRDAAAASDGQRRTLTLAVRATEGAFLVAGTASANTCVGDSGGPVLATTSGGERVVAVVSNGDPGCAGDARFAQLAWQAHLAEVVAAWDGPCAQDGVCHAGCPAATIDPDCDPCGYDGTCASGCAAVDLDCPLGAAAGADCAGDVDCESRRCLAAPDAAGVRYCSAPCDARGGCPAPLAACDGANDCVFAGGTPGVLGAACGGDDACRSHLCDTRQGVCAEPCGAGGACPAGFACGPVGNGQACTLPSTGCSAGGAGRRGAMLIVAALAIATRRRRRR